MDNKTVSTISYLSKLSLDKNKDKKIINDLERILKFVEELNKAETNNVDPLFSPLEKVAKTRKDEVNSQNLQQKILKNSPESEGGYFIVPRVVE